MKPLSAVILLLLFVTNGIVAQYDMLSVEVSFSYEKVRVKDALDDISKKYQVKFSYSSSVVNVRQRVSAHVDHVPLSTGLDELFATTPIVYSRIGQHIVLRNNPDKLLSQTKEPKKKTEPPVLEASVEEEPPAVLVKVEEPIKEEPLPDSIISLQMPESRPVNQEGKMYPFDQTLLNLEKWRTQAEYAFRPADDKRLAQVSVLPNIGTNTNNAADITNNVSVNLLWGESGGVDGMEVGTIQNKVRRDMNGFQFAGVGNQVGRNVTGTQVGGIYNKNSGMTRGLQAAGIINLTNGVQAAQAAGLVNWAKGDMAGLQASGLMNRAYGDAQGIQAAGVMNVSGGTTKVQISGLYNKAGDVQIFQTALMNVSTGQMKGLQVGLINISDTVSGVPIALINIVKRGYNHVEIYGSEILHGNFQFKLGANHFYNIFHIGAQVPPGDGSYIWGIGYGIGTMTILSPKNHLNWELMAMHINENEGWTNTLNSIGQFRFLWNYQLGRSIGFFLGPTANVMVSQLKDPETGEINPPVVPYSLINEDLDENTNLRAWVGVNAGFRF
jgi:hypothetical protein